VKIAIASGKGGTGKTSLTAAFAVLAKNAVLADCDVDAADLHLVLQPEARQRNVFTSGRIPYDPAVTAAQINALTIIEESNGPASTEIKKIWKTLCSTRWSVG